ncbi:MAG: hypothetical protein QG620_416 [Patescibacteria group bacterium]|nr:hypothetical protein [Patescibacteria group bacterium]
MMPARELAIKHFKKLVSEKTDKASLQFFRYLIAGGTATLVDLAVLFVLYHLLHINYLAAAALGFLFGVITNFTINIAIVFESQGKMKKEFLLFAAVGLGGLLWTELILWVLSGKFHLPVMAAKLVAVVLVLNWNFFMRKKFVFGKRSLN